MADPKEDIKKVIPILSGILICLAIVFTVFAATVFSEGYVKRRMSADGVYSGITEYIRTESAEAYRRSGDADKRIVEVIDSLTQTAMTEEPVRYEVDRVLSQLYSGETVTVSCERILAEYPDNISAFLSGRNISVKRSEIEEMVQKIVDSAQRSLDANKLEEAMPMSVSGGMGRAVLFIVLAAASLGLTLLISENRLRALGTALLISGGAALAAALIVNAAFKPEGIKIAVRGLNTLMNSLKRGVVAGTAVSGIIAAVGGGALAFLGRDR